MSSVCVSREGKRILQGLVFIVVLAIIHLNQNVRKLRQVSRLRTSTGKYRLAVQSKRNRIRRTMLISEIVPGFLQIRSDEFFRAFRG